MCILELDCTCGLINRINKHISRHFELLFILRILMGNYSKWSILGFSSCTTQATVIHAGTVVQTEYVMLPLEIFAVQLQRGLLATCTK